MDSINIATGLDTTTASAAASSASVTGLGKEESTISNGRPTNVVTSSSTTMPLSPIRVDGAHDPHFESIGSPRREEFPPIDIPAVETTVNHPPPQEEKKTRWGLGRKLREKKDKK